MDIEEQLAGLIEHLRAQGETNPQKALKDAELEDVPEEFRSAFSFWRTLSGPSRNLMYNVACGRQTRKTCSPGPRGRLP